MDELISRSSALAAIAESVTDTEAFDKVKALPIIHPPAKYTMHLIDTEPQIMCQSCRHYDSEHHYCWLLDMEASLTDFCSWAERMEADNESND